MKNILNRLINHETLSKDEAKDVLVNISNGSYNSSNCFILDRLHDA
jgi:anthranilate phosphoribosyltransferase